MTKLYKYGINSFTLLLFGIGLLFFACESENISDKPDPTQQDGEKIVVAFSASGTSFDNAIDDPVKLRTTSLLHQGSIVRIIEYLILQNDTVFVEYADFVVDANCTTLTPIGSPLTVSSGLEYAYVAYSKDVSTAFTAFNPLSGISVNSDEDYMWGKTISTYTPSSPPIHLHLYHLTAKVTMVVSAFPSGVVSNTIDTIRVAKITSGSQMLDVKSGKMTPANAASGNFSWIPGSSSIRTSNPVYSLPTGTNMTELTIDSVYINNTLYEGPFHVVYSKPLEVGKEYLLKVNLQHASGGSANRITLDNSGSSPKLVITRDPNDYGLYFKPGSVVGIKPPYNTTFSISFIVFNPLSNPSAILYFNSGSNPGTDYHELPSIPAYSSTDMSNNIRNLSLNNYHNLANVQMGKGDPCRLIGMTADEIRGFTNDTELYAREAALAATGVGGWRLPTNMDNMRFSGYSGNNIYTSAHWWDIVAPDISPFGNPRVIGGEFPTRNSMNNGTTPNPDKFLPAGGNMDLFGVIISRTFGHYWSSEIVFSEDHLTLFPSGLYFTGTNVRPYATYGSQFFEYGFGLPVRCVGNESPISLSVEDWQPGGTLGTGGVGDIILP